MFQDQIKEYKLFKFRQTFVFSTVMLFSIVAQAQLIDEIIGQKRSRVQALLKPYRILDYKLEREVHTIEAGIHQTVLFENDTCKRFYWAVTPTGEDRFKSLLIDNGYAKADSGNFAKDSLLLQVRELSSGKATLYIASILSDNLKGKRDAAGRQIVERKKRNKDGTRKLASAAELQQMPLLQQAILEEELRAKNDTTPKKKKDPSKHWVGSKYGKTNVLGWEQ